MLDYTSMILQETINDIKKIGHIAKYSSQGFTIAYLIYALIAGTGFWFINAPLLALAIAYLIYDLHSTNHTITKEDKLKNKKVKRLYTRIKQAIKLFPLVVALYNLCLTFENPNVFTLLSTAFMLISWLLAFVFDVLTIIVERRYKYLMEALKADWEELTKPLKEAGNFLKRVTGKEVTAPVLSKERIQMDERIGEFRQKKADKKEEVKQQRREKVKAKFQNATDKMRSKITESKLLKGGKKDEQTPDLAQLPAPKDENGDEE